MKVNHKIKSRLLNDQRGSMAQTNRLILKRRRPGRKWGAALWFRNTTRSVIRDVQLEDEGKFVPRLRMGLINRKRSAHKHKTERYFRKRALAFNLMKRGAYIAL